MSDLIGSIQLAFKTKAAWELQNPVLLAGQIAAEDDGGILRFKVGNGLNVYTARPYVTVKNTDFVLEGATNLYFTNTRADARANAMITAAKNVNNGIAGLDSGGLIPAALLPGFVDDVLEYANLAGFPVSGVTGKMYVALDTNKVYRWSGSAYIEISASPGSTDAVTEGVTNLYFTNARVKAYADTLYSVLGHSHTFASLTSKPTTLLGFGITDGGTHTIGESFGGGKVFHTWDNGHHGLIVSTANVGYAIWSGNPAFMDLLTKDGIGAGRSNTERIVRDRGSETNAAYLCHNYVSGGFADWYLPSRYELNLLYLQSATLGGFTTDYHWCSNDYNTSNQCYYQNFYNGNQGGGFKSNAAYVRAIRMF